MIVTRKAKMQIKVGKKTESGNTKYNTETEQEDMRPSRKMSKTEESKVLKF